jgi:hypothetical protein
MYVIPIVLLVLAAILATAWSPVFALVIAVPLFLIFLGVVAFKPRADEKIAAPPMGEPRTVESDTPKGPWGEPRS